MSVQSVMDILKNNFHVDNIKKCILLKSVPNPLYKIITETSLYIFKIYNSREIDLQFEVEYLNFLSNMKFTVSYPIKDIKGDLYLKLKLPEGICVMGY